MVKSWDAYKSLEVPDATNRATLECVLTRIGELGLASATVQQSASALVVEKESEVASDTIGTENVESAANVL